MRTVLNTMPVAFPGDTFARVALDRDLGLRCFVMPCSRGESCETTIESTTAFNRGHLRADFHSQSPLLIRPKLHTARRAVKPIILRFRQKSRKKRHSSLIPTTGPAGAGCRAGLEGPVFPGVRPVRRRAAPSGPASTRSVALNRLCHQILRRKPVGISEKCQKNRGAPHVVIA